MKINLILFIILILLFTSCRSTVREYSPVGTNCKKRINESFLDTFLIVILKLDKDVNGEYVENLKYEQCLAREREARRRNAEKNDNM